MVLGKLPDNLDDSRARAYCACSRCGWVLFGHFSSPLSKLKYCLKESLNPKQPTNQPNLGV